MAWLNPKEHGKDLLQSGLRLTSPVFVSESLLYERPIQIGGSAFVLTSIGAYSYVSQNCRIHHTSIGRYCSIADQVVTSPGDHPTNMLLTSPAIYDDFFQWSVSNTFDKRWNGFGRVDIGHDVWICANVVVLGGVTIGHGAILAAGSVVTKDVEPYTLVGGVPARPIRCRFEPEIVQRLLQIQPWIYDLPHLIRNYGVKLNRELTSQVLDQIERHIDEGRATLLKGASLKLTPLADSKWKLERSV